MEQVLQWICDFTAVSGQETALAQALAERLGSVAEASVDSFGNVVAIRQGTGGKTILLDAHLDEIGLVVRKIEENGTLRILGNGGVDPRVLLGCEVTVYGEKPYYGVIGATPPHLQTAEQQKKALRMEDLSVDVGLAHPQPEIRVGDRIGFHGSLKRLQNNRVTGKSLDNKAGLATLVWVMEHLERCPHTVVFLASCQEELGCTGAAATLRQREVDAALVVDVTHGETPGAEEQSFSLDSGPAIGMGPALHPEMVASLRRLAEQKKIPYTLEVMGGATGTNTDVIRLAQGGIPSALLSIPLRYMHTPVEVVSLADMQATADLLLAYLEKGVLG